MNTGFLKNVWYLGLPSHELAVGKMQSRVILGEPVVFFRDSLGKTHAIRDICPHRGIPLSYGRVINDQVECPYHGWRFNGQGSCTLIPSLCEDQTMDVSKIKVRHFPVREQQGLIWVFVGDKDFDVNLAPPIPILQNLPMDVQPRITEKCIFPCHIDHAVIGLMDPAHGPFVHKSWFWRNETSIHEKRKKFAPVSHGFQMVRHRPSSNSKAYKFLGGVPTTEITFSLPCVRVEHVQVGTRNFYAVTALTPVSEKESIIHQMAYWDLPWLTLVKPAVRRFTRIFLHQDMNAVAKQQDGLKYDPSLMLIKDADTQAKWYYALKTEWEKHLEEKRAFANPVKETELRWRS